MNRHFYRSFLDGIPLPAILVDAASRIVRANEGAIKLHPQADEDRPLILVFRQPSITAAVEACLQTGDVQRALYLHNEDAQEYRFDVRCSPVSLEGMQGALLCFQDITEVNELDRMRRDFVANVSHELRTPLTAILGFVETLQGPARGDPEANERFLGIMAAEANRMNRLVGDLLSLSRVEEVSRMRPTDPVDLDQIIRSVLQNLSPLAQENGCALIYAAEREEFVVPGDCDQLLQVVTNLIENAIKYGGTGTSVSLTLERDKNIAGVRGCAAVLTVSDDGAGIAPFHIARLTERFYRIDSHRSREMGGTGLGLAIVKHIVNRHRGRMTIESDLGKGSDFKVILPFS